MYFYFQTRNENAINKKNNGRDQLTGKMKIKYARYHDFPTYARNEKLSNS